MSIPATTETYTYAYDGVGRRHFQQYLRTTPQIVKRYRYLLDVQPALAQVLALTFSTPPTPFTSTTRFVYGPRSIFAQENDGIGWTWPVQDGLRSVRGVITDAVSVDSFQSYAPYGTPLESDPLGIPFGFTGEMTDANGLVYLRARYYAPGLGVFTALDPVEFPNRYQYVGANPTNVVDPSGLCPKELTPDGDACGLMVTVLRGWDIYPHWDIDAPAPEQCLTNEVQDTIAQTVRQRWTLGEMEAVYNAFRVFTVAHRRIQHVTGYPWPLGPDKGIHVEKRSVITGYESSMGRHVYDGRRIVMSATRWGEANSDITETQYRSWLVLHEFSHIFTKDRAKEIVQGLAYGPSYLNYIQSSVPYLPSGEIDAQDFSRNITDYSYVFRGVAKGSLNEVE